MQHIKKTYRWVSQVIAKNDPIQWIFLYVQKSVVFTAEDGQQQFSFLLPNYIRFSVSWLSIHVHIYIEDLLCELNECYRIQLFVEGSYL